MLVLKVDTILSQGDRHLMILKTLWVEVTIIAREKL